jgi:hypothetical protein
VPDIIPLSVSRHRELARLATELCDERGQTEIADLLAAGKTLLVQAKLLGIMDLGLLRSEFTLAEVVVLQGRLGLPLQTLDQLRTDAALVYG